MRREHDTLYLVRSQTIAHKMYVVQATIDGWKCNCPDHRYRGVCCKHIHSVELSRMMRQTVREESVTIIKTHDAHQCKFRGSSNVTKKGTVSRVKGPTQQFQCKDCYRRFTDNLGFEYKQATPEQITMAVELVFSGLSTRKTATALKKMKVKVSHQTVLNWAEEYVNLMESFVDKIRPQVGEAWRTDELYLKIKGNRRYLFAMLDAETRFWIAKMVTEHKGTDDVAPLFKEAKRIAGKIPTTLISDKAANFHEAWEDQYKARNFLWKDTWHINDVAFDGIHHNNQMESFNGNTLHLREKVTRGLKRDDSAIISGLRLYHNFVRPHLGLPNQITPAEAAGIQIEGTNKWMTLIQAAAKTSSR